MDSTIEVEHPAAVRERVRTVLAPMLARGLRTLPAIADAATEQVAHAFPGKELRTARLFTTILRCASPALLHAIEAMAIRPGVAEELCRLDHQGQDVIVALGPRAAQHAARELKSIRRSGEAKGIDA